jgi:membrane protease YdiL (CAAX protease family)
MNEFDDFQIEKISSRKTISRIGWSLAALMFFSQVGAMVLAQICKRLLPELVQTSIYNFIINTIPIYCIGLPIFILIIRKIPKENINEKSNLTILQFIKFVVISFASMYVFNLLGIVVNLGISILKGSYVINPISNLLSKVNVFQTIIFVGILAPVMEEVIFRKILLSRLRKFGDFFSIFLSALAFGMFHGNFSQFFYAFALGCIFAYVVIKTGTIKYSIILHIIINLFGSVIMMQVALMQNIIVTTTVGLFVFCMIIAGIALFFMNIKNVVLEKGSLNLTIKEQFRLMFENSGIMVYSIMFILLVTIVVISK